MGGKGVLRITTLAAMLALTACAQQIDTDEKLPKAKAPPPVVERESSMMFVASLPLDAIEQALDESLPTSQTIDRKIRIKLPLVKDPRLSLRGEIRRTPLQLSPAAPRIAFSAGLSGDGNAPLRWTLRGRVSGSLLPSIDSRYQLHSNLLSGVQLDEARLKLDGLPDISVRGELEDEYRKAMQRMVERLDARLNRKSKLAADANKLWQSVHGIARPSKRDPLYLVHQPLRLLLANPQLGRDGQLRFGLGLKARVLAYAGIEPPAPVLRPLPPPTPSALPAPGFRIAMPLIADAASVCEALSQALHEERIRIEKRRVRVHGLQCAVVGERLLLRLKLKSGAFWRPLEATVFLSATPYLDLQTRELRVRDLRYTLESSEALVRAGSWLVSDTFIARLQQRARMPLAPLEEKARTAATRLADSFARKSDGLAGIVVESVRIDALSLLDGYIVVDTSAQGRTTTHLLPLLERRSARHTEAATP